MINGTWRRSLLDVRVKREAEVGSDHQMVVATVKVKLRKTGCKRPGRQQLYVEKLQNPQIKNAFALQLKNKYQALADMEEHTQPEQQDVNTRWEHIKAAYLMLGYQRKEWITADTLQAISTRRKLKKQLLDAKSERLKESYKPNYRQADRKVKRLARSDKRAIPEAARSRGEQEQVYKIIKVICGKYCGIRDTPIKDKIFETIMSLKNRKTPGQDYMNAELFKADPEIKAKMLLPLFTAIWKEKEIPTDWSEGIIVRIPKALSNCNNWRGITILSIPSKILMKIITQ